MPTAVRTIEVTSHRGTKRVQSALTLDEAIAVLRPNDRNRFAQDLILEHDQRSRRRQRISFNKQSWLIVMAQEDLDRARQAQQPAAPAERIAADFATIVALFGTAKGNGKKFPKILLRTADDRQVVLALAGDKSRYPGQIMVTDGGKYPNNVWYGRIDQQGGWFPGRDATDTVTDLLRRFGADPVTVATEYGRMTGVCSFCSLELTDERSTLVGYGPICADRFGLPWGDRPARRPRPAPLTDEEHEAIDEEAEAEAAPFRQRDLTWAQPVPAGSPRGDAEVVFVTGGQGQAPDEGPVDLGEAHENAAERYRALTLDDLMARALPAARDLVGSSVAPWRDDD